GVAFAQRATRVGVGRLVEADMAVADLEEGEGWSLGGEHLVEQAQGFRHAARQGPQHASPGPHAFEGAPAGDSSFFDVGCGFSLQGLVFADRNPLKWWLICREEETRQEVGLFPAARNNSSANLMLRLSR